MRIALQRLFRLICATMHSAIRSIWLSFSLSKQFAIVAVAVLLPGMAVTGWWIAEKVGEALVRNTAGAIAISMDSILSPFVDEIARDGQISAMARGKLGVLLQQARANKTVVSMKIWRNDGTILYSSFPEMIGKAFDPSPSLKAAFAGNVNASLDSDPHLEDALERSQGVALLEVYAPLHEPRSQRIVAVSEFYANGEQLTRDMRNAIAESWLFVCAVAALMATLLSGIAIKGGQTIAAQQQQLQTQVADLKELLDSNEVLREKLRMANENVSSINEMVLQHVGADLHDGPAQRLSYATMSLSGLRRKSGKSPVALAAIDDLRDILADTLKDIRRMCGGLALPELNHATLVEAAELAIKSHEDFTDTKVNRQFDVKTKLISLALRTCIYRLVQEGLNNAFKHAGAKSQKVILLEQAGKLVLTISDSGPGISQSGHMSVKGLGLRGMQARVDALGGALTVGKGSTGGTVLEAVLPVA